MDTQRQTSSALVLSVAVLLSAGCVAVNERGFTYRDPANIDKTKLKLNGYYASENEALGRIVLWEDGTAMTAAPVGYGYDGERLNGERFSGYPNWGAFRVRGDTISIQAFVNVPDGFGGNDHAIEYNGLVQNDTTFILTESVVRTGPQQGKRPLAPPYRYHFRFLEEKPDSANWTDDL